MPKQGILGLLVLIAAVQDLGMYITMITVNPKP